VYRICGEILARQACPGGPLWRENAPEERLEAASGTRTSDLRIMSASTRTDNKGNQQLSSAEPGRTRTYLQPPRNHNRGFFVRVPQCNRLCVAGCGAHVLLRISLSVPFTYAFEAPLAANKDEDHHHHHDRHEQNDVNILRQSVRVHQGRNCPPVSIEPKACIRSRINSRRD
jgi:hypothetical protein